MAKKEEITKVIETKGNIMHESYVIKKDCARSDEEVMHDNKRNENVHNESNFVIKDAPLSYKDVITATIPLSALGEYAESVFKRWHAEGQMAAFVDLDTETIEIQYVVHH